ncbi:hypothetical protein Ancab_030417 [Ancistrocladus abbreviatus]
MGMKLTKIAQVDVGANQPSKNMARQSAHGQIQFGAVKQNGQYHKGEAKSSKTESNAEVDEAEISKKEYKAAIVELDAAK